MADTAILDSSVLYPSLLRDVLIRIGQHDIIRARWTDAILDEVFAALDKYYTGA